MKKWCLIAATALAAFQFGCPSCPPEAVSLNTLISEYNVNASRVLRLWAMARLKVTIIDKESGLPFTWDFGESGGVLLLAKGEDPYATKDFVLVGRESGQDVFRLGVDAAADVYYMWYKFGSRNGAWWGRNAFAGAPGIEAMPIDPNQLLAVLSVCELPARLVELPTVALTMNAEPGRCAYVLSYIDRQPISDRILFKRHMYFRWEKDKPRRPFRVDFLDGDGRRIVTADLKDYRKIDTGKGAKGDPTAPVMPTDIRITWIDPKTHKKTANVHIVLSKMTTADKWDRQACAFDPPDGVPILQVDKDLRPGRFP